MSIASNTSRLAWVSDSSCHEAFTDWLELQWLDYIRSRLDKLRHLSDYVINIIKSNHSSEFDSFLEEKFLMGDSCEEELCSCANLSNDVVCITVEPIETDFTREIKETASLFERKSSMSPLAKRLRIKNFENKRFCVVCQCSIPQGRKGRSCKSCRENARQSIALARGG